MTSIIAVLVSTSGQTRSNPGISPLTAPGGGAGRVAAATAGRRPRFMRPDAAAVFVEGREVRCGVIIDAVRRTSSSREVVHMTAEVNRPAGDEHDRALDALAARRFRVGMALTAAMLVVYFGFILLIAFNKPLLSRLLTDGLSLGILLGVIVVVATWVLTWVYVGWANRVYEPEVRRLRR